jgi:phytoene dehydrogenase-like protein
MHIRTAGWPAGGSLELARAIERRYRELGGEVHYRSRVDDILVEAGSMGDRGASPEQRRGKNRATGVRLADGSVHRADVVVSAADGYATIFHMLEGRYTDEQIRSYYAREPEPDGYAVHVSLGVARDLSHEPHTIVLLLDEPITAAGQTHERLTVEHFCFDPAMAPPNKSTVKVYLESAYDYWKDLYAERERYRAEKEQVASAVIEQLEHRFPGLREQIEMVDVATPVTTERFTGNRRGTQAWLPEKGAMRVLLKGMSRTLPGLEGFYMVGQWAGAMGGLPTVAAMGRNLVRLLCKRDGRPFATTVPGQ